MRNAIEDVALDVLFREARSYRAWLNEPVSDEILRQVYNLMRWAPTSANGNPARILFLRTKAAKERLLPALAPGNVDKTMNAPVTAIIAHDLKFYEKLPQLLPHDPGMRDLFANAPELVDATAKRNSSLQGAYMILGCACLRTRLRTYVGVRQREGRRGIFWRWKERAEFRRRILSRRSH